MSQRKPLPGVRRDAYQDVAYREALRALGLFAPVELDDIHRAYRSNAKRHHPDRFAGNGDAAEATRRIQKLNAAHEYAILHYRAFDKVQRRHRADGLAADAYAASLWEELLLAPVTLLYSLALLAAAVAGAALSPLLALFRRAAGEDSNGARALKAAWDAWLVLGPHVMMLAAFLALEVWGVGPPWVRWWLGISFLVMVSADLASRMTDESNPLRGHRVVSRLHARLGGR
ncbi:hypothetical protein BH18GEM1_BH18GEM1_04610 [soil metagenome]